MMVCRVVLNSRATSAMLAPSASRPTAAARFSALSVGGRPNCLPAAFARSIPDCVRSMRGPLRIRNLKHVKLRQRAANTYIYWLWHTVSLARVVMGGSIPTSQPYAVTTTTENGVRIMACVQNTVFITFVPGSIPHPKWNRFGQFHAEHALWALTCFKFRILRGPLVWVAIRAVFHGLMSMI